MSRLYTIKTHDVVSDLSVERVAEAEQADEDVTRVRDGLLPRPDASLFAGRARTGGEGESLPD